MLSANVSFVTYLLPDRSEKSNRQAERQTKNALSGVLCEKNFFPFFVFYRSVEAVADMVDDRLDTQGGIISFDDLPCAGRHLLRLHAFRNLRNP